MKSAADALMTEDMLQVYTADVFASFKAPRVMAWHTANEGKHHINYRVKMKARGVLKGVSDWIILVPATGQYGVAERGLTAFLELKNSIGRQSKEQREFQRDVEALGHPYHIARTPEEVDGFLSGIGAIIKPVTRGTSPHGREASGRAGDGRSRVAVPSHPPTSSPRAGESGQ